MNNNPQETENVGGNFHVVDTLKLSNSTSIKIQSVDM